MRECRPRMQESARDGTPGPLAADLQRRRPAVPALRAAGAGQVARAGRRQPTDVLVSELPTLRRVGHKGADHIAPGNTAASFDAALAAGVDMIEFDVLPEDMHRPADSRLLLSHDYDHDLAAALTLDEGLAHLASSPFTDTELDVDLKLPGYEARVVEALRAHGLVERALVSSTFMRSLVRRPRARAAAAARLVGPARPARLHGVAAVGAARVRDGRADPAPAPGGRARAPGGRPLRRGDGALAAGLARARGDDRRGGRRAVRVDGGRRGADPQRSRRWASPA